MLFHRRNELYAVTNVIDAIDMIDVILLYSVHVRLRIRHLMAGRREREGVYYRWDRNYFLVCDSVLVPGLFRS